MDTFMRPAGPLRSSRQLHLVPGSVGGDAARYRQAFDDFTGAGHGQEVPPERIRHAGPCLLLEVRRQGPPQQGGEPLQVAGHALASQGTDVRVSANRGQSTERGAYAEIHPAPLHTISTATARLVIANAF